LNRALLRLAGPAILAKSLYAVLALADVFWVGRLGAAPTAAVNTGFFTSWILQAATQLTAVGILAHVARSLGAGDRRRAEFAATQGLLLGVLLGAVLGAAVWLAAPWLFDQLGTADDVRQPGLAYLRVLFLAAPLTFTWMNAESVMRAAGNTRTPLLIIGVMVVVNGALDPFLIFGIGPFPRLEVLGAGVATWIAQAVAVLAFAALAWRGNRGFPVTRTTLARLDLRLAARFFRVGAPSMSIGVFYSSVYLFLSGVAARMGTVELAVLGLGNRTETLTYLVSSGFGAATAAVVGQNLGARQPQRAARAAWHSALWMGVYGSVVGAVLVLWPREVLALFTSDADVLTTGATYTRVIGLCQGLMAVEIVLGHAFAGAGDTVPPMLISVPLNAARVPLVFWIVYMLDGGIVAIGWLLSITAALRGVLAAAWFSRGRWKTRAL
jgi:putative MATE family efflux protein